MKRILLLASTLIFFASQSAGAALITASHQFNGTKFGINPGGQPVASLLTTTIDFDDAAITGVGVEYTELLSYTLDFTPLLPGELFCIACTISEGDRLAHHRVRFVDGVYQGYEMFGPILAGSGRVLLLNSDLTRTVFAIGGGFAASGLGVADRQTILFSGVNFRTRYGPTSSTLTRHDVPTPGLAALLACGIAGLVIARRLHYRRSRPLQLHVIRSASAVD